MKLITYSKSWWKCVLDIYHSSHTPKLIFSCSILDKIKKHKVYIESYVSGKKIEYYNISLDKFVLLKDIEPFYCASDFRIVYEDDPIPVNWDDLDSNVTCVTKKGDLIYFWSGGLPFYNETLDRYESTDSVRLYNVVSITSWGFGDIKDTSVKDSLTERKREK